MYRIQVQEYKLWQLINNRIGKCKHRGSIIPYITVNGIKPYNPDKIANCFGQFYADLGESLASKITPGNRTINKYINNIPRMLNSFIMWPTSWAEIEKIINMPNETSSGHDQISRKLLKNLNQSISYPLSLIFNQSPESGIFLDLIKIAEIISLYKGKEQNQVFNYHPISLLMTTSKVLEKIVYSRVFNFLEHHNLLYESQFRFRNRHSCGHAISELIRKILQAKEEGKYSTAIFLDLSKVFNILNHAHLLAELECYGFRDTTLEWFKSYLSGRILIAKVTMGQNTVTHSKCYNIT